MSFRIPVLVSFRTPPWCHLGHYFSTGRASSYHVELKVMRVTRMTLQACHDLSAACALGLALGPLELGRPSRRPLFDRVGS